LCNALAPAFEYMKSLLPVKPRLPDMVMWFAGIILAVPALWAIFARFGWEFALVLGPFAVIAVIAYRMHLKRLAEKTREISQASRIHLATVEALATAIDARDQVGLGHVRRTQIYAVGIGKLLALPVSDINALRTGALLHDIGKLAVPDHILNKSSALTPAELEKTKIHSEVGASILEKIGFDYPVVPTVRYHHERWDGRGYPEGLSGEAIPLTARILAVADAFDTLRGARPYRSALPRDKARQTIQAEAGLRFDPAIVSVLIRNLNLLEADIISNGLSYTETTATGHNYVEQIKRANREVFSLYELAREFSASVSLKDTLDLFAKTVAELVPVETCVVYLLDAQKRSATAAHVEGTHAAELASHSVKVGQGATGYALKNRENIQNVDPDLDFFYSRPELTRSYSTMASVPLVTGDELIGALSVYASNLEAYGEEHVRLLETVSRIAADAIDKSLEHAEARTQSLTDPMTGLPNSRSLQVQFDKEIARAARGGTNFQMLMLDLDGFKAVNDSFGHKVGDELLLQIGRVIRGQLRDYDFLARYGGDEFVALIPETTAEDVADLCGRIEKAVSTFRLPLGDGNTASVGVSLGSSGYPNNGESFDTMVAAADKAMYEKKMRRRRASTPRGPGAPEPLEDSLIVELDESHVVLSTSIN
jgi:diguanylate cyclase (GGDEF)-like protein/putative nucleotidyltransferase with HDIG domain